MLRRRKGGEASEVDDKKKKDSEDNKKESEKGSATKKNDKPKWGCIDSCCWLLGNLLCFWFILLAVYHAIPHNQLEKVGKSIGEVLGSRQVDPPGVRLAKEGLTVKHPVVFIPGIVTGGLELWEGRECADGLFRKRFWGGTFGEVYKRPFCWMEHMLLDNETGLDPPGIRMRPVSGLVAADYFMPGYFVWAVIIEQLAQIGYDERTMHMASYDWRLSFLNTEERDRSLSRLKASIELLVQSNHGNKVVAVPHSMGSIYFLFFLKWVEAPAPLGGGGGPDWVARHIKSVLNIAGPLLGVPKAFTGLFSAEAKDVAAAREMMPAVVDTLQTLQHIMRLSRTWDATMSMLPKGGEAVWGDLDWSPEQGYDCTAESDDGPQSKPADGDTGKTNSSSSSDGDGGDSGSSEERKASKEPLRAHYGRFVAFGRDAALLPAADLPQPAAYGELKVEDKDSPESPQKETNITCGDVWTEYHEMSWREVQDVAKRGVYTAGSGDSGVLGLLRKVAPKMMARADATWSYGVADDLDDAKYSHHKYWSNPLETKLPDAPHMEVFCLHGVGLLTERAYVYKLSPYNDTCLIPFRIDASFDSSNMEGEKVGCLKSGVYFVDGDETVPALSSGYMCAKGWRGKTRYNPSGSPTFVREYNHAPPTNLLEGRGTQSGSHVDIMGNWALVEDILRVAAGSSGEDLGGDRVFSKLFKWVESIKLKL